MGAVIGEFLPLAVGVAISPIPIVAVVLMLLSRAAGATGSGFALGWVAGIAVVTAVVVALANTLAGSEDDSPSAGVSWLKIALGAVLLGLALRQWRDRADTTVPGWMHAIDRMTFARAAGLGVLLSAVNPKNLLLCVSAGVVIGTAGLSGGSVAVALLVFTLIAAVSVVLPVAGYLVSAERLRAPLGSLKTWLQANNHAVMAVVLLVMGAVVIGKGIGGL